MLVTRSKRPGPFPNPVQAASFFKIGNRAASALARRSGPDAEWVLMAGPPLTLGGYWGAKYQGSAHPVRRASFEFRKKRIERPGGRPGHQSPPWSALRKAISGSTPESSFTYH